MLFKELTIQNQVEWSDFLANFPAEYQDIYFSPEYYKLYEDLGDGIAKCIIYNENDFYCCYPFLLNNINNLGYQLNGNYYDIQGAYGYNGMICSNPTDSMSIEKFHTLLRKHLQEQKIIAEFTRFHTLLKNDLIASSDMQVLNDRNTVYVNLEDDIETIWNNQYSGNNRNMIRKAIKSGFTVNILENPSSDEITEFREIYQHSMRKIGASDYYFFNDTYFSNLFQNKNCYLFQVKDTENKTHCASAIYIYSQFAHYHLSGKAANADNSVNTLLLDEAIRFAIAKGAKQFHLGGGNSNDLNDGLFKFKQNFSKNHCEFKIGKRVLNEDIYNEVCQQWQIKNPDKNSRLLLKYRT